MLGPQHQLFHFVDPLLLHCIDKFLPDFILLKEKQGHLFPFLKGIAVKLGKYCRLPILNQDKHILESAIEV